MPSYGYLIIAIIILIALLVIFVVSFVLYKKTPVPKGCEDILIDDEKCSSCQNNECRFKHRNEKE